MMFMSMTADDYYRQGNDLRREGKWGEAMNCYGRAAELDPDSPAVEARRMLADILEYRCKDMYNP